MISNIAKYFNKKRSNRIAIILGSGYHKQALSCPSVLSDWCLLLKEIDPKIKSTGNYILDFEHIILKSRAASHSLQAGKRENKLLSKAKSIIEKEEKNSIEVYRENYKVNVFNPRYVSDVISLNFDLVAEKLTKEHFDLKKINRSGKRISRSRTGKKYIQICNEYIASDGKTIRFWYPHGNTSRYDSMILGARKYALHLDTVEHLRKYSKAEKDKNTDEVGSWYEAIAHRPVIILGASVSVLEWDIWTAIVNRQRNFAKKINKKFQHGIFQMRSEEVSNSSSNNIWFEPLFDEKLSFAQQWVKLDQLMSS